MFNEKDIETRLPKGKLGLVPQIRFLIRLLVAAPEKEASPSSPKTIVMRRFAYVGLCAVVILLAGGAWAYSSPSVTSGDAMFFAKQLGEKAVLYSTPESGRAEFWTKVADRRLAELEYLAGGKVELDLSFMGSAMAAEDEEMTVREQKASRTLELMKEAFDRGMSLIAKISDPDKAAKVAERLSGFQAKQKARLEGILSRAVDEADVPKPSKDKAQRPFGDKIVDKIAVAIDESDERADGLRRVREELAKAMQERRKVSVEKLASSSLGLAPRKMTSEELTLMIDEEKESVAAWKEVVVTKVGTTTPTVDRLFAKIDDRLEKASEALNGGKEEQAAGLLKSVRAMENNAKSFISQKEIKEKMKKAKEEMLRRKELLDRIHMASSTVDGLKGLETIVRNENVSSTTKARLQEKIRAFEERMSTKIEESKNRRLQDTEDFRARPLPVVGPKMDVRPMDVE